MSKFLILIAILLSPLVAYAEGRCPPGQYPIGSSNGVLGCAPIPGSSTGVGEPQAPVPSGEWETRWGAVAEDGGSQPGAPMATGAVVGEKSKRAAETVALQRCERRGGRKCHVRMTYYNQCAAIADFVFSGAAQGPAKSTAVSAKTVDEAKAAALEECSSINGGGKCEIAYSACSMSEFKPYR
ncbi:MAG: DUF4189 domain-containing protein [Stenotrophomonas sp.]